MKTLVSITFIASLLFFAAGCQDDPGPLGSGDVIVLTGEKDAFPPEIMDLLHSLDFEEFSGTLHPGLGAMLHATMRTWPKNCTFGLIVPPTALPDDDDNPVEFSMRIPTYASYIAHADDKLPLLIWLEPSDVSFIEPVVVLGTYMPWLNASVSDIREYYSIAPEYVEYGPPDVWEDGNRIRISFEADHFSLWGVGGGGELGPSKTVLD